MKRTLVAILSLSASPAFAAGDAPFFSLRNQDFIVLLAFLLFIAVLVYFKVPGMLAGMLDKRAETIRNELDEARALREEAQTLLASYERKQQEMKEQAERIVSHAREEAALAADQAKVNLQSSIERRLAAAQDQIAAAESAAVKEVRDQAISVAVGAAQDLVAGQMSKEKANQLIDTAIGDVGRRLN